ncbi:GNAT family N-acetyltransferase [Streptomyces sp. PanSC19]|uniref:GNAT family N-acetyltransferase n=1 Tax=Streptomyces sp. PanSC19 TaxID=1520455 RepID=UPI000F4A4709|nr:GNAT family N-acetyltransferase [Streptomyces sp. PanSC19]
MTTIGIRPAVRDVIAATVAMPADDALGATREIPDDLTPYWSACERLQSDPNRLLVVADRDGEVVGTLQLTIVPGPSRKGSTRSIVEGVRIHSSERGRGLGAQPTEWAVDESRRQGCQLVQLTSDSARTDAHRFYGRLGFTGSHVGFKSQL